MTRPIGKQSNVLPSKRLYHRLLQGLLTVLFVGAFGACARKQSGIETGAQGGAGTRAPTTTVPDSQSNQILTDGSFNNGTGGPSDQSIGMGTVVTTTLPPGPIPCRDKAGNVISGQFTDPAQNTTTFPVDCFDAGGALLYPGQTKNCLDELTAKFGPDIIHPAMQLVPGLYKQAQAQGAGGVAFLRSALQAKTCAELRTQYP